MDIGVTNSFRPLLNSSAIVGYGSVIKSLAVFSVIQSFIFGISLDALSSTYLQMSHTFNIPPEILHKIASLASGGLDTPPYNGAVITTLSICSLTHKESYKDMFTTLVVIPIAVTVLIAIITFFKLIV